jgi:hypothetical protein
VSSFDEQDLGQRVDGALATITSGPAPAAAIVARGRRIRQRRRAARAGVALVAALAVAIPVYTAVRGGHPGQPARPLATKMSGLPMPAGTNFQVLAGAGNGAAWYSTVTRHAKPVIGLPAPSGGYQFQPASEGWIAVPNQTSSPCPTNICAGRPKQIYFIADGSPAATRIGAGHWAAASSRPGAVWLVTYPRPSAKFTESATAELISTTGRPLGPPYRLPAGYFLSSGVGSYLLLVNNNNNNLFLLWDPRTGRVLRHFDNVIATSPGQIAWSPGCRNCRVQIVNVLAGTTVTTPIPGFNPPAAPCPGDSPCPVFNATFSDDGGLLAAQAPGRDIEVFDTASRTLTAIPGTALSAADWQIFGWQAGSHRLVVAAGPNNQPGPAQLAYWQPGAPHLRIATIRNLAEITDLQTGNIG